MRALQAHCFRPLPRSTGGVQEFEFSSNRTARVVIPIAETGGRVSLTGCWGHDVVAGIAKYVGGDGASDRGGVVGSPRLRGWLVRADLAPGSMPSTASAESKADVGTVSEEAYERDRAWAQSRSQGGIFDVILAASYPCTEERAWHHAIPWSCPWLTSRRSGQTATSEQADPMNGYPSKPRSLTPTLEGW